MIRAGTADTTIKVAPLVGAWIEIHGPWRKGMVNKVAPLVGAWIEIEPLLRSQHPQGSRSSCRSVD